MNAEQLLQRRKLSLKGQERSEFLMLSDYIISLLREFVVEQLDNGGLPTEHVGSQIVGFYAALQTVSIFVNDSGTFRRVIEAIEDELIYGFGHGDTSPEMIAWLKAWQSAVPVGSQQRGPVRVH